MLRTILSILILFAVTWFAVSNAVAIQLNVFFWNISVSAALVIFVTFIAGFALGVLRVVPAWLHSRGMVGKHKKELAVCKIENKEYTQRIEELEIELASERARATAGEDTIDRSTHE